MKLTRLGFNLVVLIWLLPIIGYDIYGNTANTGATSDMFYYKTMFDGLIAAYACFLLVRGGSTMTKAEAEARVADKTDAVVDFQNLGSIEFAYALLLAGYAVLNWWTLHMINRDSQGFISIATLIWSFLSLAVAIVALLQFYHLKKGDIVQVSHKIVAG